MNIIDQLKGYALRYLEKCIRGCVESLPDARDHIYRSSTAERAEVDLEPYLDKVLYQGSAPSCVAHGVAHAIQIEERINKRRTSTPSRNWIYYQARARHDAVKTPLTGTSIRYALKAVRGLGCPPESIRKYSTKASALNKKTTLREKQAASARLGLRYQWITSDRGTSIRRALSEGHPVVFGTQVGSSLDRYQSGHVLHRPTEYDGGHCMCIIGYRLGDSGWEYKVLNSWHGREIAWFAEDYITWDRTHDLAVIDGWRGLEAA